MKKGLFILPIILLLTSCNDSLPKGSDSISEEIPSVELSTPIEESLPLTVEPSIEPTSVPSEPEPTIEPGLKAILDDSIMGGELLSQIKTDYLEKFDKENKYTCSDLEVIYYCDYSGSYVVFVEGLKHEFEVMFESVDYHIRVNEYDGLIRNSILYYDTNRIYVYNDGEFFGFDDAINQNIIALDVYDEVCGYLYEQRKELEDKHKEVLLLEYKDVVFGEKYVISESETKTHHCIYKYLGGENGKHCIMARIYLKLPEEEMASKQTWTYPYIFDGESIIDLEEAYQENVISDEFYNYLMDKWDWNESIPEMDSDKMTYIKDKFYSDKGINPDDVVDDRDFGKIAYYGEYNGYIVFQIDETGDTLGDLKQYVVGDFYFPTDWQSKQIYVYDKANDEIITLLDAYNNNYISRDDLLKMRFVYFIY